MVGSYDTRAEQMVLLHRKSSETFKWFEVDRAIDRVCNQGRALIEPVEQTQGGDYQGNG
jgi:putative SOS response-associated peptidase YedK